YFMDKVVDHLLVFKGQGKIQDFPGNYTQYRDFEAMNSNGDTSGLGKNAVNEERENSDSSRGQKQTSDAAKRKLTFKEKREYEQLEKDIAVLEAEKKQIEEALCGGTTSVDEITQMSKRLPLLNEELDEKSMRWLELSEYV
ncbi:MAG: hypothetical protein J5965_18085, partial [Aeriscardovia sp.]|nr:hypothetical protein [Aeriscardovia sp.]